MQVSWGAGEGSQPSPCTALGVQGVECPSDLSVWDVLEQVGVS